MKFLLFFIMTVFSFTSSAQQQEQSIPEPEKNTEQMQQTSKTSHAKSSRLLGMSVTGNKESPRSLTIVPWRSPLMDGKTAEITPVWQPALGLLDPEAYRRDITLFLQQRKQK